MATKQRDTAAAGKEKTGVSERRRLSRPPGTSAKGQGPATTTPGEPRKHVPNSLKLKPTMTSNSDASKHHVVKKQSHDDSHKPAPMVIRRRSFERHVPASQVHKASAVAPFSQTKPVSSSSERVSKVVKAVKAQPPLVKTKTLPKTATSAKVKTSGLKKSPQSKEEPARAPTNNAESKAGGHESLNANVEGELAKPDSPANFPPEKHLTHEHVGKENHEHHSPPEPVDGKEEKVDSSEITISKGQQDEDHDQAPEPVLENGEANNGETQDTLQTQHAVANAPPEKEQEYNNIKEAEIDVNIKPVGLIKTTPDETADAEDKGVDSSGGNEIEKPKEEDENNVENKRSEEEKPVVHKRQVGGGATHKESPVYNDVIEETASKLVEKKVNKVRALAGAFETVISLQQPDSS